MKKYFIDMFELIKEDKSDWICLFLFMLLGPIAILLFMILASLEEDW